ncbi:MAG: hypothetical protein IIW40_02785 [Clostridia bacterium]|nr:hypothetical protein [Clostridia bacterium]
MKRTELNWQVGYMQQADGTPVEWMEATVPGAVQQDYARHHKWPPFYEGANVKQYSGLEDYYWLYKAPLSFSLAEDECATLCFTAIDYRYAIRIGGETLVEGEGMFSPVKVDVTSYAGKAATVEVLIYPAPKANETGTRAEAKESCKAAACYGWDWHPRLISMGLWDEAYLAIEPVCHIDELEAAYVLSDALDSCAVRVSVEAPLADAVRAELLDADGNVAAHNEWQTAGDFSCGELTLEQPRLWYPVGYGEAYRYTLRVSCVKDGRVQDVKERPIGFRRVKLVMNAGAWGRPNGFPKSRSDAPITLEVNGRRLFAKGSNWVNTQVFPGEATEELYREQLTYVKDANMNLLRVWGGGYVNKESFFDICDELGLMIWQEFPLACNEYPDEPAYLAVLEKEAVSIVKRLRTHPCVVIWCGGNELFNGWSGMTDQHHALRLLDTVCYLQDRYTPFLMTAPLNGMGHGPYGNYDTAAHKEYITTLVNSHFTAYTEFGCSGMPSAEYLRSFMSEEDFADCNENNATWVAHHGFKAWFPDCWCRTPEIDYYFGGYTSVEDLCNKSAFVQSMCYRSAFEEMRRQWPCCSMALNWCFNEPWPTAGNNSLLSWPAKPKQAYYAVQKAMRPQLASLRVDRHLWWGGERFTAQLWVLNDSLEAIPAGEIRVRYTLGDKTANWGSVCFDEVASQSNGQCGAITLALPANYEGAIEISLEVEGRPELNSTYVYLCRCRQSKAQTAVPMLNM